MGRAFDGLVEVINNSLDADALGVSVHLDRDSLRRVVAVRVIDDGDGMTEDEATRGFGRYGASWKAAGGQTRRRRTALRGSKGQGRYGAFAIGDRAEWSSVPRDAKPPTRTTVRGSRSDLLRFEIESTPLPGATPDEAPPRGTSLRISDTSEAAGRLTAPDTHQRLTAALAAYLVRHPGVQCQLSLERHRSATKCHQ